MIDDTLEERGKRYGDFKNHARITQDLKDAMSNNDKWYELSPAHREALEMIAHKIGRIINGDPNYTDSWHDIMGYARLGEQECKPPVPANRVKFEYPVRPGPVEVKIHRHDTVKDDFFGFPMETGEQG